ncbi:phage tail protein [Pantoea sp.]|uniref:phage tail protein n=1 Tax=Pantoea sp. TaxID=69393 RepID=UPI0031E23C73
MLKPQHLRQRLLDSVPLLQAHPDSLTLLTESGRIVSTLAASLSFEYHYRLKVAIAAFSGEMDGVIVPMLDWLRVNQPDLMATKEKQRDGFTFQTHPVSDTAYDITIDLQLSERVRVTRDGAALHIEHVSETSPPEDDERPLQLYAHGRLISAYEA